eukprot:TRINITY_DN5369_c0_g2_i1.p2 TRINITY_DN5369_c0_g2~~TRINITY_DN5369_c0_g2_i1.p2  ORF type:complete len:177 (-),score=52.44 TRINITY_DN5369_c0_g2_i1:669-1199(-)
MIRRPPRSTQSRSSAASDVYKRQENNRVALKGSSSAEDEVVLSALQDPFFAANMYSNFGELGENVKSIVDELQGVQGSARAAESIEDLQNVVQNMPEIRKRSGMVSKHVSLVYEFKRQCESRLLLETSQTEQDLACNQDHSSAREVSGHDSPKSPSPSVSPSSHLATPVTPRPVRQ